MFRISVTILDAFHKFLTTEWMTEAKLIAQIKREEPPNRRMAIGSHVHKILERGYTSGDTEFKFGDEIICLEENLTRFLANEILAREALGESTPLGCPECRFIRKICHTNDHEIFVVGVADFVCGDEIIEYKTTLATVNSHNYMDSFQWRYLMHLFGVNKVTYKIFQLSEAVEDSKTLLDLKSTHEFTMTPYINLDTDIERLLTDFVEWVDARGLLDYYIKDITPYDDFITTEI